MEHADKTFTESRQLVDGNRYTNCKFDRCAIVYGGGPIPHLIDCTLDNCSWHFEDAAERTLAFLHHLYHGTGEGGREMIESTFEMVRQPAK
jgi:hypothetical protein